MTHQLFAYGTLLQPQVQTALFGREVPTVKDSLPKHRLDRLTVTDPTVIALSGSNVCLILRKGGPGDSVHGARLELTHDELARADDFEVDDYTRVQMVLVSGAEAWVYVDARSVC